MFCPNCGTQLPDGSRFCTGCGTALHTSESAGTQSSAEESVLQQDPSLPEGIFRDDQGAYHWVYHLDMKKNPVPLFMLFKIVFGSCAFTGVFVSPVALLNGSALSEALTAFAITVFGIGGALLLLTWIVWCILLPIHGSQYSVEHLMSEDRVEHLQTQEEQVQSSRMKKVVFVLALLSDDPSSVGMAVGAQEHLISSYRDVRKITAEPRHDLIKVVNLLQHNHIYAYPHQYEFVWSYLTSHCPHAKHKR